MAAPSLTTRVRRLAFFAAVLAFAAALAFAALPALAETPLSDIEIRRTAGAVVIDGSLSDAGWAGATEVDLAYEVQPGENVTPGVRTRARIAYDGEALYIAFDCEDPDPRRIRAPFADRDRIGPYQQDVVRVFLDTRNDGRAAYMLGVSPRGLQSDGVYTEAVASEDRGPDFYFDSAARIDARGWTAELRIPFASLHYAGGAAPVWGVMLMREYPREFAYDFESAPLPRGSPCTLCHMRKLTGMRDLPAGDHWVVAPYVSATRETAPAVEGDPASPLVTRALDRTAGLDLKWSPASAHTIDVALNPDFSQIESDVPKVGVNSRFALFYPEKRPLFLEGTDLFEMLLHAVSTRTITDADWGVRATGKTGATSYTMLVARDAGGGSVILPGPEESSLAPQDFASNVAIGRVRHDLGASFAGFTISAREVRGGGYNRVAGPDVQWRPDDANTITAQWLVSDTRLPARPDLAAEWDGSHLRSSAASVEWLRLTRGFVTVLSYQDIGSGFRDDNGFIPQVGYRRAQAIAGPYFYPHGLVPLVHPYVTVEQSETRDGARLGRAVTPGVYVSGPLSMTLDTRYHLAEQVRSRGRLFALRYGELELEMSPARRFDRLALHVRLGDDVDFENGRLGRGGDVTASATFRPFDRLELIFDGERQWLNVPAGPSAAGTTSARLFTADVARLKATIHFGPRAYVRLLGERVRVERDPALYVDPVPARERTGLDSVLFSYKLNWQTLAYLGYEAGRSLRPSGAMELDGKQLFVKLAYAWRN